MNKATTYQKKVTASTRNLSAIRSFVSQHAEEQGFSAQKVADIQLAVDEAYTNIIKHAYKNDSNQEVIINLEFDDKKMVVTLTDHGTGFDVEKYKRPNLKRQIEKKKERWNGGLFNPQVDGRSFLSC